MSETTNQSQVILAALLRGETLTPLDALDRFGCFRLASRISDLRKEGWPIIKTMESNQATGKSYARYTMERDSDGVVRKRQPANDTDTSVSVSLYSPAFQRQCEEICRLGPRVLCEMLREIANDAVIAPLIVEKVGRYSALDPIALAVTGGDRFPASPIREVTA